jgi:fatty acid-binding protein DegV
VLRCVQGETGPVAKVRHFEAAAKRLFENLAQQIERGLLAPFVNLSYGGDLDVIPELEGYAQMARVAAARGVQVQVSAMSMTGGVNVGREALAAGIIAQAHEFH